MLGAILNNPMTKKRLRSCATKRRTKETESSVQPAASSPSFKKDLTFTDMRKHENVPAKSSTSRKVGSINEEPEPPAAAEIALGSSRAVQTLYPQNVQQKQIKNPSLLIISDLEIFEFILPGLLNLFQDFYNLLLQLILLSHPPLLCYHLCRLLLDLRNNLPD
jgi:hypothetical protein